MADHRSVEAIDADLAAARLAWSNGAPGSEARCYELEAEHDEAVAAAAKASKAAQRPPRKPSTRKPSAGKATAKAKGSPARRKSGK